jgi:peptidoglycan/LPS O-acetylase OafA/YrhL
LHYSQVGGRLAGAFDISSEDYRQGCTTSAFQLSRGETPVRIEAAAPVDNSWIALDVSVVNAAGLTVGRPRLNLSYYHGSSQGRSWQVGHRESAQLLELPPGHYRLCVSGGAGGGASSTVDLENFGRPVRLSVRARAGVFRWLLCIACATSLATIALVLSLLSGRQRSLGKRIEGLPVARHGERFTMIDGLRGCAALAVVFCHLMVPEICRFSTVLTSVLPSSLPKILRHGDLGVEVFFVLSGFVIAHSVRGRPITLAFAGRFALRRAVRLDPPYYFTILVSVAVWAYFLPFGLRQVVDEIGGMPGMLANMVYAQNLVGFLSPVPIAWTLCLEVQFYLAYIGLLWLAQTLSVLLRQSGTGTDQGSHGLPAIAYTLVFWPLAALSLCVWYPQLQRFDFFGTWFRFFLGVTVYWVFSGQVSRRSLVALAVALAVLAATTSDARGLAALATGLLIDAAGRTGGIVRWLSSRGAQFLGRISYSLYLVHIPLGIGSANIIWSCTDQSTRAALLCGAVAVAVSLTAAWLMYRMVEGPSVLVSKRIGY